MKKFWAYFLAVAAIPVGLILYMGYVDDITYNACLDNYEGSVAPEEAAKICMQPRLTKNYMKTRIIDDKNFNMFIWNCYNF